MLGLLSFFVACLLAHLLITPGINCFSCVRFSPDAYWAPRDGTYLLPLLLLLKIPVCSLSPGVLETSMILQEFILHDKLNQKMCD